MTGICTGSAAGAGFISSMVAQIDCRAELLGSGSWAALSAPGSVLSVVLTGFMTIFLALTGYNLLFGQSMTLRAATVAAAKIGVVVAFSTSWPAYRTVIYDVITNGPSQLVSEIGPPAGVVGSDGTLTKRLDAADEAMAQIAILNARNAPPIRDVETPPPPFGGFDAFALGGSRILFELTAVASIGIVRVVAGLMLALGPFFIAFLLFDATSGLFSGWVQMLTGSGIAAIGISVALGLELALLEPWLTEVLAKFASGESLTTAPTQLFVLIGFSTLMTLAAFWASVRVASAFSVTAATRWVMPKWNAEPRAAPLQTLPQKRRDVAPTQENRAAALASALRTKITREETAWLTSDRPNPAARHGITVGYDGTAPQPFVPAGRTFIRSTRFRVSGRASKRDAAG